MKLIEWVKKGEKTDSYPFWSRVIITATTMQAITLRSNNPELDYNQIYSLEEWQRAHIGPKPVELALDDIDLLCGWLVKQGTVKVITLTRE
jgi:hypothetical protein